MKKIGVVSWFNGPNYGTVLQAIALQKKIADLGYNVELVNFQPPEVPRKKRTFHARVKGFVPARINRVKRRIVSNRYDKSISDRNRKIKKAIFDNCVFSSCIENTRDYIEVNNSYDLLIFGSDQIWNPNWFHPFYYADFKEILTPRTAYAPSIGVTQIPETLIEKYKKALSPFLSISARENSGMELIMQITGRKCKKVVDPTLLLKAEEWNAIFDLGNKQEKYVLFYLLEDNQNHIKAAIRFAKEKGLKLKVIPYQNDTYFMKGEIVADAGPKEFLELIRNAEYVITDSFHGLLFSVIFQKQFYILTRYNDNNSESQNSRIYQIINEYGLQERLQRFNIAVIQESEAIDYNAVYHVSDRQISASMHYLEKILKGKQNDK